jgi:multidrug efflux pump
MLPRAGRMLIIYAVIVAGVVWLTCACRPPSCRPRTRAIIVNVQLPPGATQEPHARRDAAGRGFMLKQPEVRAWSACWASASQGQGQNAALAFVTLKDWDERTGPGQSAQAWPAAPSGADGHPDAFIFPLSPPPIPELGQRPPVSTSACRTAPASAATPDRRAQPAAGHGRQSKLLTQVRPDGLEDAPQLQLDIDRDKAARWASASTPSTPRSPRRSARPMSTTSRARAGCSAWWCRPMRPPACSPRTCCA